jgi:hypothetical protein
MFALAAAVAGAASAAPTTYTTNAGSAANGTLINSGGAPAPLYCNASGCQTTAPSGTYATITAWSTQGPPANSTTSPTDTGTWLQAYLAIYGSWGIGISNTQQGTGATPASPETLAQLTCTSGCPASNPEHVANSPQHAIDNNGVDDFLVVVFGSSGWDVNSFSLGYTCNASTGMCGGAVAVEAWIGGANNVPINFATESFNSNNNLNAVPAIGGFSRLNLTNDPLTGGVVADPGNVTGRYLVITGALGSGTINSGTVNGYSDAFKVSQIVATQTPATPSVPIPGSLPLIGLGLLILTFARWRVAALA